MSQSGSALELKHILGALIVASNRPLSIKDLRTCLQETAATAGGETLAFRNVKETDIRAALEELTVEAEKAHLGFAVAEIAGGYRLQTSAACGKWVRHLLETDKPNRLSMPCLETLAIIAYRQPVARSEIEGVRGVNVDHVIRTLMEMQLVRIVGRSDLPGRPFLYGTTHTFLEHFGLRDLKELSDMEPMLLREKERKAAEAKERAASSAPPQPAGSGAPAPSSSATAPAPADTTAKPDQTGDEPEDEEEDEFDDDEDEDDEDDEDEEEDDEEEP